GSRSFRRTSELTMGSLMTGSFQEAGDQPLDFGVVHLVMIPLDQPAAAVEDEDARGAVDLELCLPRRRLLVEQEVDEYRPLRREEFAHPAAGLGVVRVIEADRDRRQIAIRVFLVQLDEVRELALAGQAVVGPEFDDDDAALQRGDALGE